MKKLFLLLLSAIMLSACGSDNAKKETADETPEINIEKLVEVSIPVGGMTCEGCENAVKKSVNSLEGIAEVSASHADSVAVVKYDSEKADIEAIKEKIREAGYEVL